MKTDITYYFGDWPLVSQDKSVLSPEERSYVDQNYVPDLVRAWQAIERATGYRWKCTSFLRKSPTHGKGQAIDIAPDIAPSSEQYYAVTNGSDPVLYKRTKLIRDLQTAASIFPPGKFSIGIFIEPDHLHLQVMELDNAGDSMRVFKWKIPKMIYSDSLDRMDLPMM